jgi:xylulokinase
MSKKWLSLGLDLSTQGLSAVVLDIGASRKLLELSLDYARHPRLRVFGIGKEDYVLPPRTQGEADQPPGMYMAALDAIFSDLGKAVGLEAVAVINVSGQQHGHVYLNERAPAILARLNSSDAGPHDLTTLLKDCLAYDRAPIWMTSNTLAQADFIRNAVGGRERLIRLSGSDAQLRFTGMVVRRTAERFPRAYAGTRTIQLLSSFVPAMLTGNARVPVDFGNAGGMSLMNYRMKRWSDVLAGAVAGGVPGGRRALRQKLPGIVAPDAIVGTIARYFVRKYGFSPVCRVVAGSGDNPQSKVLVAGDLLSLGSSFVNMVATDGKARDMSGAACAMYDGLGRPFMFGCRTNGALVWDRVRALHGMTRDDYPPAEEALRVRPPGRELVLWQPRNESFPPSGSFDLVRIGNAMPSLESDYPGIVESSLASVYVHSQRFAAAATAPLYVMGGATASPEVMRRVAALWNRPVVATAKAGAALGAAVAGVSALLKSEGHEFDVDRFSAGLVSRGDRVAPDPECVAAFHRPGGYLDRLTAAEAQITARYPAG